MLALRPRRRGASDLVRAPAAALATCALLALVLTAPAKAATYPLVGSPLPRPGALASAHCADVARPPHLAGTGIQTRGPVSCAAARRVVGTFLRRSRCGLRLGPRCAITGFACGEPSSGSGLSSHPVVCRASRGRRITFDEAEM